MTAQAVTRVTAEHRATLTEAPDDLDELNRFFDERGWTDGFPVVPPTPERVQKMLAAVDRAPDELIAAVPPGFGAATVDQSCGSVAHRQRADRARARRCERHQLSGPGVLG
jgi:hypothetical protein